VKIFWDGRRIGWPLLLAGFLLVCLAVGYQTIQLGLDVSLLFVLLVPLVYILYYYSPWIVAITLSAWLATIVWVDWTIASDFPISLTRIGTTSGIVSLVMLIMAIILSQERSSQKLLEQRFDFIMKFSQNFVYYEKPGGKLVYISPSCVQVTGISADEFMDNPGLLDKIILNEDRVNLQQNQNQENIRSGEMQKNEFRIEHKSGEIRWIERSILSVFDRNSQLTGRRVYWQDITALKKDFDHLKYRFERLFFALEDTGDEAVWDFNLADGEAYFSTKYASLLGFKPDETNVKLEDYYALIHPDDLPRMQEALQEHLQWSSPTYEAEYRVKTRFGKWQWVLHRGRIIAQNNEGKPTRMVGTLIEITERKRIEEALRQSEEKFRQLAENMIEVFWLRERESGKFIYISPGFDEVWGRPASELYDDPGLFLESIHYQDFSRVYHALKELISSGVTFNEEYRLVHPDSTVRWVWARAYPIYDEQGNYYRIAGIAEDISERKEAESALRESEKRYRDLIEHQGGGVSNIDPQQTIIYMNPAGEEIFGVPHGTIIGRNLKEFLGADQYAFIESQANLRKQGVESTFEMLITRRDQERRNLLTTATPRFDANGQFLGTILIFKDITQRKKKEEKLRYIVFHDTLTGLYNRAYFEDEIERLELGGEFPVSMVIVDADELKNVNDEFGHSTGNEFLIHISRVLKNSVRGGDVVARIGGDEFAILMPNCDENQLHQVLNRIETNVKAENATEKLGYTVSLSAGGYTSHQRGSLGEALNKADARMYEAKKKKKQLYVFLPDEENKPDS
jgi:diguanylate cyclase (GGDEF)-like protein/PAS domain S-box-containing protein